MVTRRTLSAGTEIEPPEGVTPSVKAPPTDATQFRLAGTPLARTVSSIECVDPGPNVALGRRAVTEGGGIHPVAARAGMPHAVPARRSRASCSARCLGRARMFLGGNEAGAGRISPAPDIA